ncbi:MAG: DNA oxidative demethylase AlkB [Myxococcales bacterium]|nr:DNA oxidative demethylase AlkB [Myxococcales bacterium]
MQLSLGPSFAPAGELALGPDAVLLRGFALADADRLATALAEVVAAAPFRHMCTPGGHRMSVGMSNCGALGWTSDAGGYRYTTVDPATGRAWPAMPEALRELARRAAATAGFPGFEPDACLVNRYAPTARMTLHQDRNERDLGAPIVSVSLGLPAVFLFGGDTREARPTRVPLAHGDVVVWGGASRLRYHGILPLTAGHHPQIGPWRINLTFRRAG